MELDAWESKVWFEKGNYKVSMMLNYSTAQEKKFYKDFSPVGFPI